MGNSIEEHFDKISYSYDYYKSKNKYYYDNLKLLLKTLIANPDKKSILDCGCGTGDILDYLNPLRGMGIDISNNIINLAKEKHNDNQKLIFLRKNVEEDIKDINFNFDYVLMIDILEHLKDPLLALSNIKKIMHSDTELIITTANKRWSLLLYILEKLRFKMPEGEVHWLSLEEIKDILKIAGIKVIKNGYRLLIPAKLPFSTIINNNFHNNIFFAKYGLIQFIVAKILE